MTDAADIDAILAATKTLPGTPRWARDTTSRVVTLAAPVAVDGVVSSLILRASATLETNPQRASAVLVYEGRPVQRISIWPDHTHMNPFGADTPAAHLGARLPPGLSRIYPWPLNRRWPRPRTDNVSVAELIAGDVASISHGLTIFLAACGIDGDLPPPPWEPTLL